MKRRIICGSAAIALTTLSIATVIGPAPQAVSRSSTPIGSYLLQEAVRERAGQKLACGDCTSAAQGQHRSM